MYGPVIYAIPAARPPASSIQRRPRLVRTARRRVFHGSDQLRPGSEQLRGAPSAGNCLGFGHSERTWPLDAGN